jgi:hypothetical protein
MSFPVSAVDAGQLLPVPSCNSSRPVAPRQ